MDIKSLRALQTNATSDSTGNYYPRHVVEKAVEAFLEKNKDKQVFGELRPKNIQITSMERQMQILASEISHEIVDLRLEDDVLVADVRVLDLTAGNMLKKMVPLDHLEMYTKTKEELGFMLGMRSLVSYSSNMQDMQNKMVDFCDIITFDIIYDPLKFPQLYPGVLFSDHDNGDKIPKLWWERDKDSPGIIRATYGDRELMMRPAGSSEWDGIVDGFVICGSDNQEEIEDRLIQHIVDSQSYSEPDPDIEPTANAASLEK